MDRQDIQDVKMARPVPVVDLWDAKDFLERLEAVTERLEILFHDARVMGLEALFNRLLEKDGIESREPYKKEF